MTAPRDHVLFRHFPLVSTKTLSVGDAPVPYHIYDGHGLMIGGTIALEKARDLLKDEQVMPIQTVDNRAFMVVWAFDFTDASLGPHNELQISLYVSRRKVAPVQSHPFVLLKEMTTNPDLRQMAHGLWNDTETVVAYNSELLGLDARLNRGSITRTSGTKSFEFSDAESGELIVKGKVREMPRTPPGAGFSLFRLFGFGGMRTLLSQPWLRVQVMNRINDKMPLNTEAQAYTVTDSQVLQDYEPAHDSLTFGPNVYAELDFQPQFVEHLNGFKFVYLNIHNAGDAPLGSA